MESLECQTSGPGEWWQFTAISCLITGCPRIVETSRGGSFPRETGFSRHKGVRRNRADRFGSSFPATVCFWVIECSRDEEKEMLILTRRVGETVMIGDNVTVTVLGVKGNQVRIGVNAPKDVAVHREEIYERIRQETDGEGAEEGNA